MSAHPADSDQIITSAMLRAQDLARIAELEAMLEWARDAMQEYQIAGTADITRLLAKGTDAERGAK